MKTLNPCVREWIRRVATAIIVGATIGTIGGLYQRAQWRELTQQAEQILAIQQETLKNLRDSDRRLDNLLGR
jgi:hypothetical protein